MNKEVYDGFGRLLRADVLAAGCLFFSSMIAVAADTYVWTNSPTPSAPYATWQTAAHTIQEAVDAASPGDTVFVTNGLYKANSITNYPQGVQIGTRVAVDKAVHLQSMNGYAVTVIEGVPARDQFAVRCVYLTNGASMSGFTIRYGGTDTTGVEANRYGAGVYVDGNHAVLSNCFFDTSLAERGGGIYGGTIFNSLFRDNEADAGGGVAGGATLIDCRLENNVATNGSGGGVVDSTLTNCVLTGNRAQYGGAVYESVLYNCLLVENTATFDGGGVYLGEIYNSTIYSNHVGNAGVGAGLVNAPVRNSIVMENRRLDGTLVNYQVSGILPQMNSSCTIPIPSLGAQNIAGNPRFADVKGGDFALLPLSPCINVGVNAAWMNSSPDLAGEPRIYEVTVDMGAYEWQGASNAATISITADLDFGYVTTGMVARRTITLSNIGPDPLQVLRINCPEGFSGTWAGTIASGAMTNVVVEFSPMASTSYGGGQTNYIDSYATGGDDTFTCSGSGNVLQIPVEWLAQYSLPTNRTDPNVYLDFEDLDGDGMSTWAEWRADTNPTNAQSYFEFTYGDSKGESGVEMSWVSSTNRYYSLYRTTNLITGTTYSTVFSNMQGLPSTTSYTDTNYMGTSWYFYRIEVDD